MSDLPKTLGEVKDKKLTGYELKTAYYLELQHGSMGFFPAIVSDNKEIVICLDKDVLEKVWNMLPKRRAKLCEILLLVNQETKVGFDICNDNGDKTEPLTILNAEAFEEIKKNGNTFQWASGLFSLEDDPNPPSPFENK